MLTPREFETLSAAHETALSRHQAMYAGLQATLHNAHFKHPDGDGARFSMEDFMSGGRKPQTAEDKVAAFKSMLESRQVAIEARKRAESPDPASLPEKVRKRAERMRTNGR